ncbi:hypothetical protein [Chitinibacter bivalviorum]|nr:hypothetical protein [Chitinibacter bivalviorum]
MTALISAFSATVFESSAAITPWRDHQQQKIRAIFNFASAANY